MCVCVCVVDVLVDVAEGGQGDVSRSVDEDMGRLAMKRSVHPNPYGMVSSLLTLPECLCKLINKTLLSALQNLHPNFSLEQNYRTAYVWMVLSEMS